MKLFTYFYNNGQWNGCGNIFMFAESAEEVRNTELYQGYINNNFDLSEVREAQSDDILSALGLYSQKDNYNITINISKKS